jgi:hypothetical protein
MNPTEEVGKTARSFFDALKDQPLSLALVTMNFGLIAYLFYSGSSITMSRAETTKMIVAWQERTDTLMANCVSKDVLESVVGALERQLAEMRKQLNGKPEPGPPLPVPIPQPRPPVPPPDPPMP